MASSLNISLRTSVSQSIQLNHNIEYVVTKRQSNFEYIKRVHQGRVQWLNSVLLSPNAITTHLPAEHLAKRSQRWLLLGMSLAKILELSTGVMVVRGVCQLMEEFAHFCKLKEVLPPLFPFSHNSIKVHIAANASSDPNDEVKEIKPSIRKVGKQVVYDYLLTPNVPGFNALDYCEVVYSLCDVIAMVLSKFLDRSCATPVVHDAILKADHKLKDHVLSKIGEDLTHVASMLIKHDLSVLLMQHQLPSQPLPQPQPTSAMAPALSPNPSNPSLDAPMPGSAASAAPSSATSLGSSSTVSLSLLPSSAGRDGLVPSGSPVTPSLSASPRPSSEVKRSSPTARSADTASASSASAASSASSAASSASSPLLSSSAASGGGGGGKLLANGNGSRDAAGATRRRPANDNGNVIATHADPSDTGNRKPRSTDEDVTIPSVSTSSHKSTSSRGGGDGGGYEGDDESRQHRSGHRRGPSGGGSSRPGPTRNGAQTNNSARPKTATPASASSVATSSTSAASSTASSTSSTSASASPRSPHSSSSHRRTDSKSSQQSPSQAQRKTRSPDPAVTGLGRKVSEDLP